VISKVQQGADCLDLPPSLHIAYSSTSSSFSCPGTVAYLEFRVDSGTMPKGGSRSAADKRLLDNIAEDLQTGEWSQRELAAHYKISESFVARIKGNLKRYGQTKVPKVVPQGRRRLVNPEMEQDLVDMYAKDPDTAIRVACQFITDKYGVKVGTSSISRVLKRLNLGNRRPDTGRGNGWKKRAKPSQVMAEVEEADSAGEDESPEPLVQEAVMAPSLLHHAQPYAEFGNDDGDQVFTFVQRTQCLALMVTGALSFLEIEQRLGIGRAEQATILKKAYERGYNPAADLRIFQHYIED
jgi:transposase